MEESIEELLSSLIEPETEDIIKRLLDSEKTEELIKKVIESEREALEIVQKVLEEELKGFPYI